MKQQIWTYRIPVSALIALVGLGIGISCSKDTGVSSKTPPVATKPALLSSPDFYPQTNVDYNPFPNMSLEERKAAIGGAEGAEKHLQVIIRHLAHAQNSTKARHVLHSVVPKRGNGEINLSQVAIEYPDLLQGVSGGFKDAISEKAIDDKLSEVIKNTDSNGEAILKASKALFDVVLTLMTPDGEGWDPSVPIPVFYVPVIDDDATVMEGVDANLNRVTIPLPFDKAPYPFLLVNFDESLPLLYEGTGTAPTLGLGGWLNVNVWLASLSLTTPAYADGPSNHPCYHENAIQPVKSITIYNAHEHGSAPDIEIGLNWPTDIISGTEVVYPWTYDLELVDTTHNRYTNYAGLRVHGICGDYLYKVFVVERDYFSDDTLADWFYVRFDTAEIVLYEQGEVYLVMEETNEDR